MEDMLIIPGLEASSEICEEDNAIHVKCLIDSFESAKANTPASLARSPSKPRNPADIMHGPEPTNDVANQSKPNSHANIKESFYFLQSDPGSLARLEYSRRKARMGSPQTSRVKMMAGLIIDEDSGNSGEDEAAHVKFLIDSFESTKIHTPASLASSPPKSTNSAKPRQTTNKKLGPDSPQDTVNRSIKPNSLAFMNEIFAAIQNDPEARNRLEECRRSAHTGSPQRTQPPSPQLEPSSISSLAQLESKSKRAHPSQRDLQNCIVAAVTGSVTRWVDAVTFHYADGTSLTYAPSGTGGPLGGPPETCRFPLHAGEFISSVSYKDRRAAINQHVLGCGVRLETSFGRALLLCGRPDPCFSWAGGDRTEWRAGPGRAIVGLCLGKVTRRRKGTVTRGLLVPSGRAALRERAGGRASKRGREIKENWIEDR